MKANIAITMENAAFRDACNINGNELARLLRKLACHVDGAEIGHNQRIPLYDANGNMVGVLRTSKRDD